MGHLLDLDFEMDFFKVVVLGWVCVMGHLWVHGGGGGGLPWGVAVVGFSVVCYCGSGFLLWVRFMVVVEGYHGGGGG